MTKKTYRAVVIAREISGEYGRHYIVYRHDDGSFRRFGVEMSGYYGAFPIGRVLRIEESTGLLGFTEHNVVETNEMDTPVQNDVEKLRLDARAARAARIAAQTDRDAAMVRLHNAEQEIARLREELKSKGST